MQFQIYGGGVQHQPQDLAAATARAAIAGPQRPGLGSGAAALHRADATFCQINLITA